MVDETAIVSAVRAADAAYGLFAAGEVVVVGMSGGPDSVALADALRRYSPERACSLHLAHLDHMLRPGSADDAVYVSQLAARWGTPISLAARDVAALAAETGRSLEETARQARYAFLATVALETGASTVAVAHQADDQAETVLMNFLRGSGVDGLKAMTHKASYPLSSEELAAIVGEGASGAVGRWPGLTLVRPLLAVTRAEILAHLAQTGLEAREDPSNRDMRFLRNRIRHEIIPLLETINPRLRETLRRTAASAADDLALLDALAAAAWSQCAVEAEGPVRFRLEAWRALAPAIQRRLLRRAVAHLPVRRELGWDHIEAIRQAIAGQPPSSLPGALRLERDEHEFWLAAAAVELPALRLGPDPIPVPTSGVLRLPGGWSLSVRERAARDGQPAAVGPWTAVLDATLAGLGLAVRGRRPGDRIEPLGMAGKHRSIQDLFVDHHVPRSERDAWPLVVVGDEIIWVPGLRLAERARVQPTTGRLVLLTVDPPTRLVRA